MTSELGEKCSELHRQASGRTDYPQWILCGETSGTPFATARASHVQAKKNTPKNGCSVDGRGTGAAVRALPGTTSAGSGLDT